MGIILVCIYSITSVQKPTEMSVVINNVSNMAVCSSVLAGIEPQKRSCSKNDAGGWFNSASFSLFSGNASLMPETFHIQYITHHAKNKLGKEAFINLIFT